jgi:6-pyruvoyl-tetrahydropterin synthase
VSVYEVSADAAFRATHSVRRPDGSMESAHQHDWRVTAAFRSGALDADGFVMDFLALREALAKVTASLRQSDLNAALDAADGASAERLAESIARRLAEELGREPHCVRVVEAPGCTAAFFPAGRPA